MVQLIYRHVSHFHQLSKGVSTHVEEWVRLFLFLCGVMIGALGSYFLQAGDLDQNSRHLLTRVPLLAGNAD